MNSYHYHTTRIFGYNKKDNNNFDVINYQHNNFDVII